MTFHANCHLRRNVIFPLEKCHILFSWKSKKIIINKSYAEFAKRVVKVNFDRLFFCNLKIALTPPYHCTCVCMCVYIFGTFTKLNRTILVIPGLTRDLYPGKKHTSISNPKKIVLHSTLFLQVNLADDKLTLFVLRLKFCNFIKNKLSCNVKHYFL